MKPRPVVYDTYWKFAAARQEVFFARLHNQPRPWTNDPILDTFKFCNTYRASDRVSQFLIRNVIFKSSFSQEDTVFRILLFKIFNKIETWQHLEKRLGEVTLKSFDPRSYARLLEEVTAQGDAIYTSAYMSCANKAFGYERKHENHLALLEKMFLKDHIEDSIIKARNLRKVFEILIGYPLVGSFLAYQLSIDLNYSDILHFSENDFTVAGPGAERGIKKCFESIGDHDYEYVIQWMCENQEKEFERLGLKFKSLWGRPLHAIDCQGLFCETDKYSRAAFPELKSNRKRIKSKFQPLGEPIHYFYPPKWGLNDVVALDQQRHMDKNRKPNHYTKPTTQLAMFP